MRTLIFTLLILSVFQLSHAQKEGKVLIDSLIAAIPEMKEDTVKARTLARLSMELREDDLKKGIYYGEMALNLSSKLGYTYGMGYSRLAMSCNFILLSKTPETIDNALEAQKIFERLKDKEMLCATYCMLCAAFNSFDPIKAKHYYLKAKELLPECRNVKWQLLNTYLLATYSKLYETDKFYTMLMNLEQLSKSAHSNYYMALTYSRLGDYFELNNIIDSSFFYDKKALDIFKNHYYTRMMIDCFIWLGNPIYWKRETGDSQGCFSRKEAEEYVLKGMSLAKETGEIEMIKRGYKNLYLLYKDQHLTKQALYSLEQFNLYQDSIKKAADLNRAATITWKYEKELKEQQLELLKLRNRQLTTVIIATSVVVAILVIVVLFIISSRRKLNKAYNLVNQQKEEISRVLNELETSNLKLETSNKELEAFSYSVSHDLRAPVRRIEGLCNLLNEDYVNLLDDAGKDLLSRITNSTLLMNTLIEDILNLSRITRQTVTKTPSNLSEMAGKICEDVRLTYPGKAVICSIEKGMHAEADAHLVRIALQNMIDNAFKYCSKAEQPEVTIGSEMQDGRRVFFIRDNGIGFDMKQSDKLFTPFQRLHSDDEFKGTGIGLATVKRIIVKHGGTIRAESEPGIGTTFFFSLG